MAALYGADVFYQPCQMANQRARNKTLALTMLSQAAKSYCASPVGPLTAVNQPEQSRLQTERHFNVILGALHIKRQGSSSRAPISVGNNEVTRCIMRQVMLWSAARHEGFQALLNIDLSKQV